MTYLLAAWCSVAYLYVFSASSILAQCGSESPGLEVMLPRDTVAVVFRGSVASIDRAGSTEIVLFDVDRAWKGPVKQQMTIYRQLMPDRNGNTEFPLIFERGNRYLVVAHRLSAVGRTYLGVHDREDAFGTDMCGDGSRPFSVAAPELRRIGPGRQPDVQPKGTRRPLTTQPRRIGYVAPIYPPLARAVAVRGTVIVRITIDETGSVSQAEVLRSIPLLDQAIIDCIRKWEYLPGLIDGVPRPITITVAVTLP